jgi:flagellar hook-basal body complex protein FliE
MNSIPSLGNLQLPSLPTMPNGVGGAPTDASFKNMLVESIQQVNSMQQQADAAVEGMATGKDVNPVEVLTAVQKADMAFKLTMQIRNKLVSAYQEVQNIRV